MYTKAVKKKPPIFWARDFSVIIFDCNLSRYLCTYIVILCEYSIMVCKVYIVEERGRERGRESPQPATQEIKIKQPR